MHEVETKILNVNSGSLGERLRALGAAQVLDTRLRVDWFWPQGTVAGQEPWFLRIRTDAQNRSEVTWKGRSKILGAARKHPELNLAVSDPEKLAKIFESLGLEKYAHQEKDRVSWTYQDWRFDLDQYPGMPGYLEIEGKDETHVQQAIALLGLSDHETSSQGERILIQKRYGLNWYDMRF
ncbi:MAG: CYTH domain-containing protein [Candidatus Doudnabacteria bacterium]|nr:CYTH domain-containing protein [Candidatus Doudnabacteria bacterium]